MKPTNSNEAATAALEHQFPPLAQVNKPTVTTEQAAYYLNRRPQTLRIWAMGSGPILPLRINGRLAWRKADIEKLLGVV
ncbi:MAG: helix-turn-helix domain-containing protein [Hydrogenophaga sp.]|jgi:hypothetical protein|nr:helix-turn-helix domain-containing protein [Hydrogenophaga sp.]